MHVVLREDSPVCSFCFREVWFQFVFAYFNDKLAEFPESHRRRPACWYGINCRTMQHNSSHASKLFHVCPQSHFN